MAIPDAVIAPSGLHVNAMALGGALVGAQKELIPWNEHAIRGEGRVASRVGGRGLCSGLSIGVVRVSHRSSTA